MKNRVGVTIGVLHVCALISVTTGALLLAFAGDPDVIAALGDIPMEFIAVVCSVFGLAIEVTVWG